MCPDVAFRVFRARVVLPCARAQAHTRRRRLISVAGILDPLLYKLTVLAPLDSASTSFDFPRQVFTCTGGASFQLHSQSTRY